MSDLLIIDNYDSFTYNLVQYFGELGCEPVVRRNDQISLQEIGALRPGRICISPGPGTPNDAGVSNEIVRQFGRETPILGVCLGHQCIAQVCGGEVIRAPKLMHGKVSPVRHKGGGIFAGLANPFPATRYHSLIVRRASLPACLTITAESDDGEIMGLQHRDLPLHGVQFHPESILTIEGKKLLANFLAL
jgi:anthranilate synthase/aminodeoxychorismate synthase-like glutamine amidotransferase